MYIWLYFVLLCCQCLLHVTRMWKVIIIATYWLLRLYMHICTAGMFFSKHQHRCEAWRKTKVFPLRFSFFAQVQLHISNQSCHHPVGIHLKKSSMPYPVRSFGSSYSIHACKCTMSSKEEQVSKKLTYKHPNFNIFITHNTFWYLWQSVTCQNLWPGQCALIFTSPRYPPQCPITILCSWQRIQFLTNLTATPGSTGSQGA